MSDAQKAPLIIIVGPTATAKTELAVLLAERAGGEIVSADSVQVYRHFDKGSGKPSVEERARAPHHLIDIRDPLEPLEAKQWAELAQEKINEIRTRGGVPIVCGGTFLWVRALIFGLAAAPAGDAGIRERHREMAQAEGRAALHRKLQEVDPVSAQRLHENDFVRVSRALEVHEISGTPLSTLQQRHGFREPRFSARLVSVDWERSQYEERLRKRVLAMLEAGWVEEVRELIKRGYVTARAMDTVGYRQVRAALETREVEAELNVDELALAITQVTRVFARRQRTWLRDEEILRFPAGDLQNVARIEALFEELQKSATS